MLVLFSAFVIIPLLSPSPERTLGPESSSPSTSSRNIEISYSAFTRETAAPMTGWGPNSGKIFLEVNMTIKNNGYDSFSTGRSYFYVIADNVMYHYDAFADALRNKWETVNVLDGGTFNGVLMFQIPETATAETVTLGYEHPLFTYNIIWTKK